MFPGWHFVEHLMKPRLHEHLKLVQGPLHLQTLEVLLAEVHHDLLLENGMLQNTQQQLNAANY